MAVSLSRGHDVCAGAFLSGVQNVNIFFFSNDIRAEP